MSRPEGYLQPGELCFAGTCTHLYIYIYQVSVDSQRFRVPASARAAHVSVPRGDRDYTVTVSAVNGAGPGQPSSITIRTDAGVFPPEITGVPTNLDRGLYTLTIDGFRNDFGPLRLVCCYL